MTMRRKTFDALLTSFGLVLAAVLLASGGLLTWASSFVGDQVNTQLSQQQIFFPPKGPATASPEIGPFLNQYAGQQLLTGQQAEAYADHFIAVHLKEAGVGQAPDDTKLAGQVATMFKGETLRGLLLNAYAFGTMGRIAGIAAISAFVGAAIMLLLSLLGFAHLRQVSPEEEVLAKLGSSSASSQT